MLGKGVPSITYGLRGLNYYQIELTGPERDLHSGVQITLGAGKFNLVVVQTTKPVGNRRNAFPEHRGVGDDQSVGLQFFLVLLHVIPEADAAHFFFAFDQYFYVDGELAVHLLKRFECFQVNMNLTFVVGGPTAKESAVADARVDRGGS